MLMWLNKNVIIINVMLKILDITNLRSTYKYIYAHTKFGFKIGALNPNLFFHII